MFLYSTNLPLPVHPRISHICTILTKRAARVRRTGGWTLRIAGMCPQFVTLRDFRTNPRCPLCRDDYHPGALGLRDIGVKLGFTAGLLQHPYGLFLNLPDAFFGKVEILAEFLEVHRLTLVKPEAVT